MAGLGSIFKCDDVLMVDRYLDYHFDPELLLDDMSIGSPALGAGFRFRSGCNSKPDHRLNRCMPEP